MTLILVSSGSTANMQPSDPRTEIPYAPIPAEAGEEERREERRNRRSRKVCIVDVEVQVLGAKLEPGVKERPVLKSPYSVLNLASRGMVNVGLIQPGVPPDGRAARRRRRR